MRRRWVLALAALLVCGAAATGQQPKPKKGQAATRNVKGVVSKDGGAPAAGVVVYLKNTKSLQIRSFITKDDGEYFFNELSPDVDYELSAKDQNTGAASSTKILSSFDSRTNSIINLELHPKK
ncbi:MAG TPA: carboxypeptidase-like regulatory domain-containing protein [Bryobacteraceae bacterium]|nr:carboxypeptidase-like regulatory domain-containing protein [Bryobacteraceae bacterium]